MGIGTLSLVGVDVSAIMTTLGGGMIGLFVNFITVFPLSYHFLGGVRHLVYIIEIKDTL